MRCIWGPPFAVFLLFGCSDGGLVGTGTGPGPVRTPEYQMRSLPDRISPVLPGSVIDESRIAALPEPGAALEKKSRDYLKSGDFDENEFELISGAWWYLADSVTAIEALRLDIQKVYSLLDSVMDNISQRCDQQNDAVCVLAANTLSSVYSEAIVNRLIKLNSEAILAASNGNENGETDLVKVAADELLTLTDTVVEFGELRYG